MAGTDQSTRIARLAPADLSAYKILRDEALRLYPDAFDADIESEQARPPESYLGRLGLGETRGGTFLLGAWEGRELIGMIGLERQTQQKLRHSAELNSMMVHPRQTGRGIGIRLIEAAIEHARQAIGLEQIVLRVSTSSSSCTLRRCSPPSPLAIAPSTQWATWSPRTWSSTRRSAARTARSWVRMSMQ